MSDRHPSGHRPDPDAYGFDPYSTGTHQAVGTAFADDTTGTYVSLPYIPQQYAPGYADDTGGWSVQDPYTAYDPYAGYAQPQQPQPVQQQPAPQPSYDGHAYDHPSYDQTSYDQTSYDHTSYGYSSYGDQSYENTAYTSYDQTSYQHTSYDPTNGYDTGTYTTTVPQQPEWDSGAYPVYGYGYAGSYGYGYDAHGDTGLYEQIPAPAPTPEPAPSPAPEPVPAYVPDDLAGVSADVLDEKWDEDEPPARHDYVRDGLADGVPAARSRRRKPAKRSALLTVAVPSVAVMGVAAVGAAAVTGVGMAQDSSSSHTQADGVASNAPTQQLDRQLAGINRDADDFAARANRSQERVDLKERQAAAKKAAEAEAARKEALRPKFVLPVKQKGLSAYFGQAGEHWMTIHTGIDFPVQPGTPVMAATDGTVRTQWNPSYGNMAIVTAPDGTETWYCHLSSTKIRSGKVKAGTVIAYSGNTGNTTGPHLHFEVRPHGGAPVDPLPWLLAHGLDPR